MKSLVSEITSSVNEFNLNIIYMCFFSFIFQKNFYVFKNFKDFSLIINLNHLIAKINFRNKKKGINK